MGYGTAAETRGGGAQRGALLLTAGMVPNLREGVELALRHFAVRRGRYARLKRSDRRSPMAEPGGILGEIVARKRVDVAARLAGAALDRGARRPTGAACARRWPGRARASSWR